MGPLDEGKVLASFIASTLGILESPHLFVTKQEKVYNETKEKTKEFYDNFMSQLTEDGAEEPTDVMPELFIEEFDDEQIWQELELLNRLQQPKLIGGDRKRKLEDDGLGVELGDEEDDGDEEENDNGSETEQKSDNEWRSFSPSMKKTKTKQFDDLESDNEDSDQEEKDGQGKSAQKQKGILKKKRGKSSIVDDKFFRLDDLSFFLDAEDKKEERRRDGDEDEEDEEDEIDLFGEIESEDENEDSDEEDDNDDDEGKSSARNFMYDAFFASPNDGGNGSDRPESEKGAKNKNAVKFPGNVEPGSEGEEEEDGVEEDGGKGNEEGEDAEHADFDDVEEDGTTQKKEKEKDKKTFDLFGDAEDSEAEGDDAKSSNEKRLEKLKKRTAELEEENLGDKGWQMKGEVLGLKRPENSLLEEHLQFDQTPKTGVLITQSFSEALENLVKQRIKDKVWDDVERKVKPVEDPFDYKKRLLNDDEKKSKQSLAEVYETEFLKIQTKEEKDNPAHKEIQQKMDALFRQLDALANFHFTPKPAAADITVISSMPSLALEDATPVTFAESQTLAPNEIAPSNKGLAIGKDERTETDKKRDLRKKKKRQRDKQKIKEKNGRLADKANPGLGNKYSKEKMEKELKAASKKGAKVGNISKDGKTAKSSKAFFENLQTTETQRTQTKEKVKKKKNQDKSVKTLKL